MGLSDNFSHNLRELRKRNHLSQKELAGKLRVAQSTVGMWESGKRTPKLDEIKRLSLALNVTVNRLIDRQQRKVEIVKNEVYIDGEKIDELDTSDIDGLVKHIKEMKAAKKDAPASVNSSLRSRGAKKILIVDDDQEICSLLYSFLVPHNYKVFLTFNGQMGLEYFGEISPDVVLLDLTMPDIDGIDVLRIIRKISSVPVVLITGHPEDIVDIHLEDLHVEGYIEKPFSLEQILNTLKHILGA